MHLNDQHLVAEVQYDTPVGMVHSDICNCAVTTGAMTIEEWRSILHASLDEWLDKGDGSGIFYVGDTDVVQYDVQED